MCPIREANKLVGSQTIIFCIEVERFNAKLFGQGIYNTTIMIPSGVRRFFFVPALRLNWGITFCSANISTYTVISIMLVFVHRVRSSSGEEISNLKDPRLDSPILFRHGGMFELIRVASKNCWRSTQSLVSTDQDSNMR